MLCPICACASEAVFERPGQAGSVYLKTDHSMDLQVAGCRNCDFFWNVEAFADPERFLGWMAQAYQSYQLLSDTLHGFPLVDPRAEMAENFLDRHCDWPKLRHVLEVGSNRGDFLAFLQSRHGHLQVLGLESSALPRVGVPTLFGDAMQANFSPSFDLVVARQVLEHTPAPEGFLRHLGTFLSDEGLLFIEVPDLEIELAEGVDPFVIEHVGHYSVKALERLGDRAGLNLVAVDRRYQLGVLFRKGARKTPSVKADGRGRWERLREFADNQARTADVWRELTLQGYGLCFYGASNVYLAVSGVLRQRWGAHWDACERALVDDFPQKHGERVGGLRVTSWEEHRPGEKTIYVVCAMYRYHRQKMIPTVESRMGEHDKLFAMWTPLRA